VKEFWLCFVPLFVAVDAIGVLPMFVGLTEGLPRAQVRRITLQSVGVATVVGLAFLVAGKALLRMLGITVADFMVAGGALLFILSVRDLLSYEKAQRQVDPESLGAVPIGVPLIVGPAVLTTTILLTDAHGMARPAVALVANILLAGCVFRASDVIMRSLGNTGAKTVSKLASLLLAAIAVMIVRRGVVATLTGAAG
jgi:multiple antibiotic resistance protein